MTGISAVRLARWGRAAKATPSKHLLHDLPESPGVYLFYGAAGELLYVGKSKSIRSRVRAHFSARDERRLCRRVRRIDCRETAGELGASLLESRLIKELRPLFNVASRRRRRILLARRAVNSDGYACIRLEAVDRIDPGATESIMGIFKHTTQAKEFLATIARSHRLCPKLLRLEQSRTWCFAYHLGACGGACMGEEDAAAYNARVDEAFETRRIQAWPYPGPVSIEEVSENSGKREVFVIDNWCLVASTAFEVGSASPVPGMHRFDYDSYKILYAYLTDPGHRTALRVSNPNEPLNNAKREGPANHIQKNTTGGMRP